MRGLDVSYGDVQVLFDVDFEVDEGEIVALLGTNGAGKSTLLKAICGVISTMRTRRSMKSFDSRWLAKSVMKSAASYREAGGQGSFPGVLGWLLQDGLPREAPWASEGAWGACVGSVVSSSRPGNVVGGVCRANCAPSGGQ